MLDITKTNDGSKLTLVLSGRVDAETTYLLDDAIDAIPSIVTELVIDMGDLEYVSSSGLRALLTATKTMRDRGGACTLANVPDIVTEVFEMTGLNNVFTIA